MDLPQLVMLLDEDVCLRASSVFYSGYEGGTILQSATRLVHHGCRGSGGL